MHCAPSRGTALRAQPCSQLPGKLGVSAGHKVTVKAVRSEKVGVARCVMSLVLPPVALCRLASHGRAHHRARYLGHPSGE